MTIHNQKKSETDQSPLRRAALHTLGCRLNQAETEALRRSLEEDGYQIVPWGEEAELYVLNSCTVTAQADAKTRQALNSVRKHHPKAKLALVGCYAQVGGGAEGLAAQGNTEGLAAQENTLGLADLIVGNQEKMNLTALLPAIMAASQPEIQPGEPLLVNPPISRAPFTLWQGFDLNGDTRAALKIQDGCDFMCSYCIIPTARGRSRPRAMENLLEDALAMAEGGAKEIVLTGVNIGSFDTDNSDNTGATLVEVVDRLDDIKGLERIRISSIEPTTVGEGILARMGDPAHSLVPFLHLPLQSASEAILKAMRRRYNLADYRSFALEAVRQVPDLCLGTDVMAGFPGEDSAAFEQTRKFLEEMPFAYFHVFPFSLRKGTPAVRMPEQVPPEIIRERVAVLRELSEAKRLAFHKKFEGTTRRVLFEKPPSKTTAGGYTDNYIRVEVSVPDAAGLRNRLLPVRLLESSYKGMAGVVVESR